MLNSPFSDMAFGMRQQAQIMETKQRLQAAGQELTTGQTADITSLPAGTVRKTFGIDAARSGHDAVLSALRTASSRAGAAQAALERVGKAISPLGTELLSAVMLEDSVSAQNHRRAAEAALSEVVSTLNTSHAGVPLFGGAGAANPPLGDAGKLLSDIKGLVQAAPDSASALAAVDAYFDDPAGAFRTSFFAGSETAMTGPVLPDGSRIDFLPTAADQGIREVLKSLTLAAVSDVSGPGWDGAEKRDLAVAAADRLTDTSEGVLSIRASLGQAESRISGEIDSTQAEMSALEQARNALTGVDPYVAATRFADLEGQLQSVFTVTARLSNLSLTNFLR